MIIPSPDDVYMFSYTSGTTGNPKGVQLTHKMILGCAYAVSTRVSCGGNPLNSSDSYVSYLPAAHSFEQAVFGLALSVGMKCGFFGGDVLKLIDDCAVLKPTCFPSVPRLYNRIFGKINDKFNAATGCKGSLIKNAVAAKLAKLKSGGGLNHCFYDKLVFSKVKAMLGGQARVMITGSAPIHGEVLDFLKIAFCSDILEGYGMTETSAGSCITFPGDPTTGIVGGPL